LVKSIAKTAEVMALQIYSSTWPFASRLRSKNLIQYVDWIQELVIELLDLELTFSSDDVQLVTLKGYINNQNIRYWRTENLYAVQEVSLHNLSGFPLVCRG
jgi:hypothetical protein